MIITGGGRCIAVPPVFSEKGLTMEYEEAKKVLVEALTKKLKTKSKFYFNDLAKILESKPRDAKKLINKMVEEGILEYWSSGSTSMYGMPGTGKQAAAEHEEKEE
jgi:4-diphosphocytidyl-2C-methyl-D-erythritol kinase